jgi:protease-4
MIILRYLDFLEGYLSHFYNIIKVSRLNSYIKDVFWEVKNLSWKKVIGGIVVGLAVLSLVAVLLAKGNRSQGETVASRSGDGGMVGIIEINGAIMGDHSATGLFSGGTAGAQTIMQQLRQVSGDPGIKAVVLRINSPGGTPAASQEITDEIIKLKKSGVKVVTSMGDVAASGAYWIASASDLIVANPGTITGSIGVIMQAQNYQGLMDKLGVSSNTIKSGTFKDMGSPDRPMTGEEKEIFQSMVEDTYSQFVETVARGRNLSPGDIRELNGKVLTGRQALEAGLVDKNGNLYDAISLAGEMAGLGKNPRTVNMEPRKQWWRVFENVGGGSAGVKDVPLESIERYYGVLLLCPPMAN